MPAGLGIAESSRTRGRIMHHNVFLGGFLQDDEMVHVPMQDAWRFQVREVFKLHPNGASGEIKVAGKFDDVGQRGAPQRERKPLPERR